jgi:hypothetical protein
MDQSIDGRLIEMITHKKTSSIIQTIRKTHDFKHLVCFLQRFVSTLSPQKVHAGTLQNTNQPACSQFMHEQNQAKPILLSYRQR